MAINNYMKWRAPSRVFGNFGVSFFGPLVAGNVADTIYDAGLSFEQIIVISFVAAAFTTGLSVSRELVKYGEQKWKKE
jgi:hypothetical protein